MYIEFSALKIRGFQEEGQQFCIAELKFLFAIKCRFY